MAHLTRVGNSLGIRIPKAIIIQLGFKEDTELAFKVTDEGLLILPTRQSRNGWNEAFQKKSRGRKEKVIGEEVSNQFDQEELEW